MEFIEQNLTILLVILLMLLGAFLIGYFFGNSNEEKTEKTLVEKAPAKVVVRTKEKLESKKEDHRIEIEDISEPGKIRATKTRERAGKLSEEVKTVMASKEVDYSNIGTGDASRPDDFKKIVGIGSFVEEKLNTIGIYNYSQLSQMTDEDILAITKVIEFFPGRIHRDDWKGQAKDLIKAAETEDKA